MELFFLTLSLVSGGAGLLLLWQIGHPLLVQRRYLYLVGSLLPPMQLIAYYFVLPIPIVLASGLGYSDTYGIEFSQGHIAYVQILTLGLVAIYLIGFRMAFGPSKRENRWSRCQQRSRHKALWIFFLCLAFIDAYFRANAIYSGTYFSWMRKFADEETLQSSSLFFILIGALVPLLGALATYFSRERRITLIYLAVLIVLVLLEGRRTNLVLLAFSATVVYLFDQRFAGNMVKRLRVVGIPILVVPFLMSVILDVRKEFRSDVSYAIENPVTFLFEATESSVLEQLGLSERNEASVELRGSGFSERSIIHLITFSSIIARYFDGYDLLPVSNFFVDSKRAFPSVLVGEKSSDSPGNILANHYGFSATVTGHHDPGSTVYQAIFAIFGPIGAITLALIAGLVFGRIFRFIAFRYGPHGWVMAVGFVGLLMINGNNYSAILVNIRHLVMLLVLLEFLTIVARLRVRAR